MVSKIILFPLLLNGSCLFVVSPRFVRLPTFSNISLTVKLLALHSQIGSQISLDGGMAGPDLHVYTALNIPGVSMLVMCLARAGDTSNISTPGGH